MSRPALTTDIDPDLFNSYYWYRSELEAFAKLLKLSRSGGKFAIHDRISHYLRTGEKLKEKKSKPKSNFDWATETLTLNTAITDSYKNTQNVRAFFKSQVSDNFKFYIDLMNFMTDNIGATLADAVNFHNERELAIKSGYKQKIEDHNQFNLYTREFLADNPELSRKDVNKCWAAIIEIPRLNSKGRGIRYSKDDLKYLS